MNTENLIEPGILFPERKLRLFSMYVDFAAATRARWVTGQISRLAGESWQTSSEMWSLDTLSAGGPIRTLITREAAAADVLVLAMSSLERREQELVQWLDSLADVVAGRPAAGLLIGLLGDEHSRAGELDWTVKQFLRCAQRLDRDFIWHWMEPEVMNSNDWLTGSVEALLTRKLAGHGAVFLPEAVLGGV